MIRMRLLPTNKVVHFMKQFFDYYLKGTKEPRWMKEGIHLRERGIDQKYDLLEK